MATKSGFNGKQFLIWICALILGSILGALGIRWINTLFNFVAAVYTRLFQFLAVPTIALAIMTTMATLGARKNTGKIFLNTIFWTLLTTISAAIVGVLLYKWIAPGNLPINLAALGQSKVPSNLKAVTYFEHLLSVVPDNILRPFFTGNVMSILVVAVSSGLALALMEKNENVQTLIRGIFGLQELLFALIRALVWTLPVGIVAFAGQLAAQVSAGVVVDTLGKYVLVVLGGNLLQIFVVLPIFLLCRGINPVKVFRAMLPALLMALFTKSSAATLPVTIASAENNLKAKPAIARFILPICCTINMNGCAAFILVTSLFVMQNGGITLSPIVTLLWVVIAVISAIGNAGVPMGCYFLTLSLMAGRGAPIWILGIILPLYTIIDMIETMENVWSDCCICAIVDKKLTEKDIA